MRSRDDSDPLRRADVTTNFSRGGSHGEELVATARSLDLRPSPSDRNTLAGVCAPTLPHAKWAGSNSRRGQARSGKTPSLLVIPVAAPLLPLCRLLTLGQMRAEKDSARSSWLTSRRAEGLICIVLPPDDFLSHVNVGLTGDPVTTNVSITKTSDYWTPAAGMRKQVSNRSSAHQAGVRHESAALSRCEPRLSRR